MATVPGIVAALTVVAATDVSNELYGCGRKKLAVAVSYLPIVFFAIACSAFDDQGPLLNAIGMACFLFCMVLLGYIGISPVHAYRENPSEYWLFVSFTMPMFLVTVAVFLGMHAAEGAVSSRDEAFYLLSRPLQQAIFDVNSPIGQKVKGKQLLLLFHQNNSYYLVEKEEPLPKHPTLYIVPDDQAGILILQRQTDP